MNAFMKLSSHLLTTQPCALHSIIGTIVLKLGNERPVASLDTNTAKLVWARGHDIQTISLKGLSKETELVDGERIAIATRDLGACEVYPQVLAHNANGAFLVVCGDGEYIIYTSQALRNKAFGSALDFVWSSIGTGDYAIRESISRVRVYHNFKEHRTLSLPISSADGIYGGACLGVKGPDCVLFYTWDEGLLVRKIDVLPQMIYWNEASASDACVIACRDAFYVLKYHPELIHTSEDAAFELVSTHQECVHTGQWLGECFLFTTGQGSYKLQYLVGGELVTLCHLNAQFYLLGYVPKEDRVFLIDKAHTIVSYRLLLSVLSYQTAVVREDFATANALLPTIPRGEYNAVARFLESQGYKAEALAVTQDADHKFELAIDLKHMDIATKVLAQLDGEAVQREDSTDLQSKWRRLGDLALFNGDLALAETCALRSGDSSGLLLLHSCTGNYAGMQALAVQAQTAGRWNVAFLAHFLTGQIEAAMELLLTAHRLPEAALLARTYLPSQVSRVLALWKADLKGTNSKAAEALADPAVYPNLFPDFAWALKAESLFLQGRQHRVAAGSYLQAKGDLNLDLIALLQAQGEAAVELMTQQAASIHIAGPKQQQEEPVTAVGAAEHVSVPVPVSASPVEEQEKELDDEKEEEGGHMLEEEEEEEEDKDLEALLEEEQALVASAPVSPAKASPANVATSPMPAPVEEEDEDELNLEGDEGLEEEDGEDLLDQDDEAFESGEDW
jgi:coatomer subunit beta'